MERLRVKTNRINQRWINQVDNFIASITRHIAVGRYDLGDQAHRRRVANPPMHDESVHLVGPNRKAP